SAAALAWLRTEEFSGRAASLAATTAGIGLGQWDVMRQTADVGRAACPQDPYLSNTSAFAAIECGYFEVAREDISRGLALARDDRARFVLIATSGLLSYRQMLDSDGSAAYERAVRMSIDLKDRALGLLASAYWVAEEVRAAKHDVSSEVE